MHCMHEQPRLVKDDINYPQVVNQSKSSSSIFWKKSKVVRYSITSIGQSANPGFLSASPQLT